MDKGNITEEAVMHKCRELAEIKLFRDDLDLSNRTQARSLIGNQDEESKEKLKRKVEAKIWSP